MSSVNAVSPVNTRAASSPTSPGSSSASGAASAPANGGSHAAPPPNNAAASPHASVEQTHLSEEAQEHVAESANSTANAQHPALPPGVQSYVNQHPEAKQYLQDHPEAQQYLEHNSNVPLQQLLGRPEVQRYMQQHPETRGPALIAALPPDVQAIAQQALDAMSPNQREAAIETAIRYHEPIMGPAGSGSPIGGWYPGGIDRPNRGSDSLGDWLRVYGEHARGGTQLTAQELDAIHGDPMLMLAWAQNPNTADALRKSNPQQFDELLKDPAAFAAAVDSIQGLQAISSLLNQPLFDNAGNDVIARARYLAATGGAVVTVS